MIASPVEGGILAGTAPQTPFDQHAADGWYTDSEVPDVICSRDIPYVPGTGQYGAPAWTGGMGGNSPYALPDNNKEHAAGELDIFAAHIGGSKYTEWQQGYDSFEQAFMAVSADTKNKIAVNLTCLRGASSDMSAAAHVAADEGRWGTDIGQYTNWELYKIRQHPEWWNRISWYYTDWSGGYNEVVNPF